MKTTNPARCGSAISFIIFLIVVSSHFSYSQGTAAPFLTISPSPEAAGMGGSGAVLPSDDPFNFFFNPAQLGFSARNNNFSFAINPISIKLSPLSDMIKYDNYTISGGYNIKEYLGGLPLSVGAGFMHNKVDMGEFIRTAENGQVLGKIHSYEEASTLSLGFCFDYFIRISGGLSYKLISSDYLTTGQKDTILTHGSADAFDLGLLVELPIFESQRLSDRFALNLGISAGYSFANWGSTFNYTLSGFEHDDPLPRSARIGLGLTAGIDMNYYDYTVKLVKIDLVSEASDILVTRDNIDYSYKSALGDINIWDNVLMMRNTSTSAVNNRGINISIMELGAIRLGVYSFDSSPETSLKNTIGYSISSKGILKLINPFIKSEVVDFIIKHFNFGYSFSKIDFGSLYDQSNDLISYSQDFHSIEFHVTGF